MSKKFTPFLYEIRVINMTDGYIIHNDFANSIEDRNQLVEHYIKEYPKDKVLGNYFPVEGVKKNEK